MSAVPNSYSPMCTPYQAPHPHAYPLHVDWWSHAAQSIAYYPNSWVNAARRRVGPVYVPPLRRTKTVWRNVVTTEDECFSNIRSALLWQKSSRKRKRGSSAFPFIPKQVIRYPPPACDDKDAFFDAPDTCQSRRRGAGRKRMSDTSGARKEVSKRKKNRGTKKRTSRSPAKNAVGNKLACSSGSSSPTPASNENARRLDMVAPGALLMLPHKAVEPDSLGRENPVWAFYPATVLSAKPAVGKGDDFLTVFFRWRDGSGTGHMVIDANEMRSGKRMLRSMRRKSGRTLQDKKAMRTWGCLRRAPVQSS